jgi:hypothetical protein
MTIHRAPDLLEKNASSVSRLLKKPKGGAIAFRHRLRRSAANLHGAYSRTAQCGLAVISGSVTLLRSARGAHYSGIHTCGSIWNCPVCAAKIAEGRKCEVEALLKAHVAAGGAVYMLTLTMPHCAEDGCKQLRDTVADAWRKAQAGRKWGSIKAAFGIFGTIRALEVTCGERNGWHPHLHILLLTKRPLDDPDAMHKAIQSRWADKVMGLSGEVAEFAASDLRPATAADYITKWGAASEVSKASAKDSRKGGRSPWQLLADYANGDKRAGRLYLEYCKAFFRARHLTYSKGLREHYGLREAPDDELARGEEIQDALPLGDPGRLGPIARIDKTTWRDVVAWKLTGDLLAATVRDGFEGAKKLFDMYGLEFEASPDQFETRQPAKRPPSWVFHRGRNREINRRYMETMNDD